MDNATASLRWRQKEESRGISCSPGHMGKILNEFIMGLNGKNLI